MWVYLEQLCWDGCVGVRCNSCIICQDFGYFSGDNKSPEIWKKNVIYQNMFQIAWITIFSQIKKRSAENKNYIILESNNKKRKMRFIILFIIFISVGSNDSGHESGAGIYGSSFKFLWRCIWMEQNIWRLRYAGNRYLHSTWQVFFLQALETNVVVTLRQPHWSCVHPTFLGVAEPIYISHTCTVFTFRSIRFN